MVSVVTIGGCTLYRGDCLEVLPLLGRVDAVVTDPPYGMSLNTDFSRMRGQWKSRGKRYRPIEGDGRPFDPTPWLALRTPCIFWGAQHFASRLPDVGGWLVFNKRDDAKPSGICIGDAELAWCNNNKQAVRMYSKMWFGGGRWANEGAYHPAQKPVGLMAWCIEHLGTAKTILDPYMGSGTTGVACAKLGRRFIGIEIDEGYFDIAVSRIEKAYAQPDMLSPQIPEPVQQPLFKEAG